MKHLLGVRRWIGLIGILGGASAAWPQTAVPPATPATASATNVSLTLEQIMADPDWIARSPERPFIGSDNQTAYYFHKDTGSELRSLWRVSLDGGAPVKLTPAEAAAAESATRITSVDRRQTAWLQRGNLFLRAPGGIRQLTRTGDATGLLTFIGADQVAYRAGKRVLAVDLTSGLVDLLASLETTDDPDKPKEPKDAVTRNEARLLEIVRLREARRAARVAQENELAAQPASAAAPIYLGKDTQVATLSLSPDGKYLLVGTTATDLRGRREKMAAYVNASATVEIEEVRTNVGADKPTAETLTLITLATGERRALDLSGLPGIHEDPLAELRAAQAKANAKPDDKPQDPAAGNKPAPDAKPKARAVYVFANEGSGARWSDDGRLALCLFSYDNKDRWLVEVSPTDARGQTRHRLTNEAWVGDSAFNEFDWLPDGRLWFTSEETGYSHLYVIGADGQPQALTHGAFEVDSVQPTADGAWFYIAANVTHPGTHEVYRVRANGSDFGAVTALGGDNTFELSADGRRLLIVHSTTTRPPELYTQAATPGATAIVLTDTIHPAFKDLPQIAPEIVTIPSRMAGRSVYGRLYRPAETSTATRPAVFFVHGAGYLQNAHQGWSTYFREHLFHQLLVKEGFVVLDLDYRGSAGYGAEWRTAIYRTMGTPELEDYLDGLDWAVANAGVDRNRVGIYGGSYGGFLTLMALFKQPGVFAAGAALRPVTDWAHYNHGYTSNILNTPDIDPEAYARSSPIEFAEGLRDPLLLCSGMLDDNVFFQDTVRLVQRLIELKKPSFDTAFYPIEPHGFREPTSWLDEYRRIHRLMVKNVKEKPAAAR